MAGRTYGVILKEDGSFFMVAMKKTVSGWRLNSTRTWDSTSVLRNNLLLHRGVITGVPSFFKLTEPLDTNRTGGQESAGAQEQPFTPQTNEAHIAVFEQHLANNLCAVVPEDAFLCTVGLALGNPSIRSFVSVYRSDAFYRIGIIIDARLVAVFPMAPASDETLEAHLFRIEKYMAAAAPAIGFPSHLYLMGKAPVFSSSHFVVQRLSVDLSSAPGAGEDVVKAAGVALAAVIGDVFRFRGASGQSAFRHITSALYVLAAVLMLSVCAFAGGLTLYGAISHHRLETYKARYHTVISGNATVRQLMSSNDSLARSVLRLTQVMSKQTRWAQFLELLAKFRPSELYFDKFGSESANSSLGTVRIALSGWSKNESHVTDVIFPCKAAAWRATFRSPPWNGTARVTSSLSGYYVR